MLCAMWLCVTILPLRENSCFTRRAEDHHCVGRPGGSERLGQEAQCRPIGVLPNQSKSHFSNYKNEALSFQDDEGSQAIYNLICHEPGPGTPVPHRSKLGRRRSTLFSRPRRLLPAPKLTNLQDLARRIALVNPSRGCPGRKDMNGSTCGTQI